MAWGKLQCTSKPISQLTLWLLVSLEVIRFWKLYFINSCYNSDISSSTQNIIQWSSQRTYIYIIQFYIQYKTDGNIETRGFHYYYHYWCYYYCYYYCVDHRSTIRREGSFSIMQAYIWLEPSLRYLKPVKVIEMLSEFIKQKMSCNYEFKPMVTVVHKSSHSS